ncbi:hypothetical protein D4R75_05145 [bacterium]|nr:MAG: hypothetical protein D4R75_05145 [bacterium]
MFLSKRGNDWYLWYEDVLTGEKRKISTGCSKKSDALKYLAANSLTPSSPVPKTCLSESKAEFATTNALSCSGGDQPPVDKPFELRIDRSLLLFTR